MSRLYSLIQSEIGMDSISGLAAVLVVNKWCISGVLVVD